MVTRQVKPVSKARAIHRPHVFDDHLERSPVLQALLVNVLYCTLCCIEMYAKSVCSLQGFCTCYHVAGLQGNVLQKILETQQLLVEQTNTATYSLTYMLARSSPYELHKAPSSASSNPELKKSLISTYGLMDRKGADGVYLRCQATGEVLLSGALVAGHLFPRRSAVRLLHWQGLKLNDASNSLLCTFQAFGKEWGLTNPDDDARNALVWFDGIEQVSI